MENARTRRRRLTSRRQLLLCLSGLFAASVCAGGPARSADQKPAVPAETTPVRDAKPPATAETDRLPSIQIPPIVQKAPAAETVPLSDEKAPVPDAKAPAAEANTLAAEAKGLVAEAKGLAAEARGLAAEARALAAEAKALAAGAKAPLRAETVPVSDGKPPVPEANAAAEAKALAAEMKALAAEAKALAAEAKALAAQAPPPIRAETVSVSDEKAPAEAAPAPPEPSRLNTIRIPPTPTSARRGAFEDPTDMLMRVRAVELRKEHGEEFLGDCMDTSSDVENIRREWLAGRYMVHDHWALVSLFERDDFVVTVPTVHGRSADLNRFEERYMLDITRHWSVSTGVTVWGGHAYTSAGAEGQADFHPNSNVDLQMHAQVGLPWDVLTEAVQNGAHKSGFDMSLSISEFNRLQLVLASGYSRYGLEGDWDWGSSVQGMARLNVKLFGRAEAFTGQGFLDPRAYGNDPLDHKWLLYVSEERKHYDTESQAVPVSSDGEDQRVGMEYHHPINLHWGVMGEAYIGQDKPRGITLGKLYGFRTRVLWTLSDRVRLWGGAEWSSESAVRILGGRSTTIRGGFNINF